MPTLIEVELLAGRYHAHVWGEAQFAMAGPEWPPSPWRLLRALASAWFETRPAPSTIPDRDALFEALGRGPAPEMWLPVTTFREIRYYQPLEEKRALHHDFFAVPSGGRFYFVFELFISPEQAGLLDILLKRVQYFGRAESHATLRRVDLTTPPSGFFRVLPRERATTASWAPRPVLCPSAARAFRAPDLWQPRPVVSAKKSKRGQAVAATTGAPVHLVDALLDHRKPLPDGCLRVQYAQPDGSIVHELAAKRAPRQPVPEVIDVKCLRFRLCRRIPIPIAEVVAVARAYRDEAVRIFKAANPGSHSRALTGREGDGLVARGNQHVYYQPQSAAHGLEISMIVVTALPGLSLTRQELDALLAVERIRLRWNERYPITLIPETADGGDQVPSQHWTSLTPFLPPHHHRPGRAETVPEEQLLSCIESSCGVRPVRVTAVKGPSGAGALTLVRAHEYGSAAQGSRGVRTWRLTRRFAHWFTVQFSAPVALTGAVGKDAHFGLGQFAPSLAE